MNEKTQAKPLALEIEVLEQTCNPGCGTSTTSHKCTCPVSISTAGSLFTSKTVG